METLKQAMHSGRMIKLVIGESDLGATYHVSQTALEDTADYFRNALRHQYSLGNGQRDTLTFPEDDHAVWDVLLFWMHKHKLPSRSEMVDLVQWSDIEDDPDDPVEPLYIRCWALGDKYGVAEFQDAVMLELIRLYQKQSITIRSAKRACDLTPSGSVLRELVAEELICGLSTGAVQYGDLDMLDGVLCFTGVLMDRRRAREEDGSFTPRIPLRCAPSAIGSSPYWKFMIRGQAPPQHWLHESIQSTTTGDGGGVTRWLGKKGE